jgi:phosphohistidine phosphatase
MKTLLILRHAKSSWKHSELADHDRPLNKRGKRDAPRIGKLLRQENLVPELILSSTAKRARRTAEAVAQSSGYENEIHIVSAFYHAGSETFYNVIARSPDQYSPIMIVGHNPGLEVFLEDITGYSERLPTAALAHVDLPINHWVDFDDQIEGNLINLWLPRELLG